MGSYGRNFDFRVPPVHGQRGARYILPSDAAADLPIGVPIVHNGDDAVDGRLPIELATGAQAPVTGLSGILVYESDTYYQGNDPVLTTYSDIDTAPRGRAVQMVSGDAVKVLLRNTEDRTFLNVRDYEGRVMVAGLGATPTLTVGDYLTPGTGNDTAGYWTETADADLAWLVITGVDADRGEVEARFVF